MGSAGKRVIDHRDIAVTETLDLLANRGHRIRHGAKMNRDRFRLRDKRSLGVEQRARAIAPFFDVGTVGRANEVHVHLLRRGGKRMADDFERDRIHQPQLIAFVFHPDATFPGLALG